MPRIILTPYSAFSLLIPSDTLISSKIEKKLLIKISWSSFSFFNFLFSSSNSVIFCCNCRIYGIHFQFKLLDFSSIQLLHSIYLFSKYNIIQNLVRLQFPWINYNKQVICRLVNWYLISNNTTVILWIETWKLHNKFTRSYNYKRYIN